MTTISAVITADGVFCTGDTLVTTNNGMQIKDRFSCSKKVVEGRCVLHSQYDDLEDSLKNEKVYNIGFGFAGHVNLIESLKSRINHKVSYGSYGKASTIRDASLENIVVFYISIFNQILSDHLMTYYANEMKFTGLNENIFREIYTTCLFFGYCNKEQKHIIYKIKFNDCYKFEYEKIDDLYRVVTIGDKEKEINSFISKGISKSHSIGYHEFSILFNSLIFKCVINKEYSSIGGTISPYHLYKNNIHEFILYDPFYKKYSMGGLYISNKNSELQLSSHYALKLDIELIGELEIIKYYVAENHDLVEIIKYINDFGLRIQKIKNLYKAYIFESGEMMELTDFPYGDGYSAMLIDDILERSHFFIPEHSGFFMLNYQYDDLYSIFYSLLH